MTTSIIRKRYQNELSEFQDSVQPQYRSVLPMSGSSTRSEDLHSSKKQRLLPPPNDDDDGTDWTTYYTYTCTTKDDRNARQLLKQDGFDPEDVKKACFPNPPQNRYPGFHQWSINTIRIAPMIFYCYHGNFHMCRYLLFRGADGRQTSSRGSSPMLFAALGGHLEIIQWLFHYAGARDDVSKPNSTGASPLRAAVDGGHEEIVQWLILHDALSYSPRQDSDIEETMIRYNLCPLPEYPWEYDKRRKVLSWARDAVSLHDNFQVVLTGTILPAASFHRHPHNQYATRSTTNSSPLVMFKGTSGILEMIAAYVGKPNARAVRTLRQLLALLPAVIEDTSFATFPRRTVQEETDEEQQDDDDDDDDDDDY